MSRWARWSKGTDIKLGYSSFQELNEAGQPMPGDPDQIAQQQGWTGKNFGWYTDGSGQIVARNLNGTMYVYDSPPTNAGSQVDQGNPTPAASGMKPADRARQLGLRSNGKGGYLNDNNQVVARTVNNELVFYDQRPGGGAVSDGAGGQTMAQSQPSWQDPVSGLIVVPPAKPENEQEIAMVPDPIPATAPAGFNNFVMSAKMRAHTRDFERRQAQQELEQKQAQTQETYGQNPAALQWYEKMNAVADQGLQSGDEYRSGVATIAKQMLEDNADEYVLDFAGLTDDYTIGQMSKGLQGKLVGEARRQYFEDNIIREISEREDISPEEKRELVRIAEEDPETGKAMWEPLLQLYDDTYKSTRELESSFQDLKEPAEEFEGEFTTYTVKNKSDGNDAAALSDAATEQLGQEPTGYFEVMWNTNNEADQETTQGRRQAAFDALKTWRQQVLPSLPVGSVVYNYPEEGGRNDNQRARIYQLAGLGPENESGLQAGVIVDGENGPRVVPLGGPDTGRLREDVLDLIVGDLDDHQAQVLYETFFQ